MDEDEDEDEDEDDEDDDEEDDTIKTRQEGGLRGTIELDDLFDEPTKEIIIDDGGYSNYEEFIIDFLGTSSDDGFDKGNYLKQLFYLIF